MPARRLNRATALGLGLLMLGAGAHTGHAQAVSAGLPLFRDATPLELTLELPFRELRQNTRTREEVDGLVHFTDADGARVTLDVEVRVRGNSRLAQCDFPPLRVDFKRGQLDDTVFAGQNRLKLVTLCKSQAPHRNYLALEYDIYRLFNELTERSFRVRRLEVTYVTTDARRPDSFTEPAFFIEEDWEAAARHNADVIERERLELAELDAEHTALLSVFQYVIGNTDWAALRGPDGDICCHNGKVLDPPDRGLVILPYDFDQSGLINADYAVPAEFLRIRSVRQRTYRGFCLYNDHIERAVALILERREALERVVGDSQASERARTDALEYLRESLEILASPEQLTEEILEECRG